jgi:hypothetical protein
MFDDDQQALIQLLAEGGGDVLSPKLQDLLRKEKKRDSTSLPGRVEGPAVSMPVEPQPSLQMTQMQPGPQNMQPPPQAMQQPPQAMPSPGPQMPAGGPQPGPQMPTPQPGLSAPPAASGADPDSVDWMMSERERYMKQLEAANAPPDYSKMQEFAKQRSGQGRQSLLLALAAQAAGQGMEPMGGAFLKQAMAAQQPIKMGGGLITPEGQFIVDPEAQAERKMKLYEGRVAHIDKLLQGKLDRDSRAELRREQNALTQKIAEGNQAIRAMAASAAAGNAADRQQQGNWRIADSLSKQFDAQVKEFGQELAATQKVKQLAPTALGRPPNAVEQQSMMILLNKFLDPGSVVREGEFSRVAQAQGFIDRAQNYYNQIAKGQPLGPQLIKDIGGMADLYEKAARSKITEVGDLYSEKARRRGLDPMDVVVTPYYTHKGQGSSPAAEAPAAGAKAPAVRVFNPATGRLE